MSLEAFETWKLAFDKEMSEKAQEEALKGGKGVAVMTEAEKIEFYAKVSRIQRP